MAGSLVTTDGEAMDGGPEAAGAWSGTVDLCLYPEETPDSWGASESSCGLGQLGPFVFDGCRYQLLDVMAHDVDPFLGNHSPCCYSSTLLGCP